VVDHGLGDVGVDAFDAGHAVAESLKLQSLVGAVFVEPGFVGVPQLWVSETSSMCCDVQLLGSC
jgi:hypothetical protein